MTTGNLAATLTERTRDSDDDDTYAGVMEGMPGSNLDDLRLQVGEPITMTEEKPIYLLLGHDVAMPTNKSGINPGTFGNPIYINQGQTAKTYNLNTTLYDTLGATDPNWDSNLNGSIALLCCTFKNLTSHAGTTTEESVKTFMHTSTDSTFDPVFAAPTIGSDVSAGGNSYFVDTPYDEYSEAEENRLNTKFGWDRTYSANPDEYVYDLINVSINTIANDLRSGVLSRFDLVKTTEPMTNVNHFLEKITENETSETGLSISAREFSTATGARTAIAPTVTVGGSEGTGIAVTTDGASPPSTPAPGPMGPTFGGGGSSY